jgi:hypothetical protein
MSTQINDNTWECSICHKHWDRVLYADACEKSHEIIYVPMKREEIQYFVQYIFTGNQELLDKCQTIITNLMKLVRSKD